VDAGEFQPLGLRDVARLVEPGLQLDEHRDVFAGLRGADERLDDRALRRGAVEHLLDGQHLRVGGGFFDELDDGVEGIVRMDQQDVALGDLRKDRLLDVHVGGGHGLPGFVPEGVEAVGLGERHEGAQFDGAVDGIDVRLIEPQMALQCGQEAARGAAVDFQSNAGGFAPVVEQILHAREQV
jgi:hypothetical protein